MGRWRRILSGPGYPNVVERIESGLLSYGGDSDDTTNPYEVRLGKYVDLHVPDDVVGIQALRRIHREGPRRHQLGAVLEGDEPTPLLFHWHGIFRDRERVGDLTNCVWSRRLGRNIGFALVTTQCVPGDRVEIHKEGRIVAATLQSLPFL